MIPIAVRELRTPSEMSDASRLLARVWDTGRAQSIVDHAMLIALAHAENYVAGAFRDDDLIGVCVGFFHAPDRRALHSHVAGVVREAAGTGVGYAMKLHQRSWALDHGATTISWTFDPLVARNAYFNLHRLGAAASAYLPDFYGEMGDGVNRGQLSDRMEIRWDLTNERTRSPQSPRSLRHDVPAALAVSPAGPLVDLGVARAGARCRVEIPSDIEEVRRRDPSRAAEWRIASRGVLTTLMDDGWRIDDFERTGSYLLEKC